MGTKTSDRTFFYSIKYYDFNKSPIICPKCEFEFDPDLLLKSRKGRSIATKTEVNEVSSDVKKEEETLEDDINAIEMMKIF